MTSTELVLARAPKTTLGFVAMDRAQEINLGGRPSLFTPELAEEICERIAAGETLMTVCEESHMPTLRTVMRWVATKNGFRTEYVNARAAQAERLDHQIDCIGKNAGDPLRARVELEASKWRAARLNPRQYGEKLDLQVGQSDRQGRQLSDTERELILFRMVYGVEKKWASYWDARGEPQPPLFLNDLNDARPQNFSKLEKMAKFFSAHPKPDEEKSRWD